MVDPTPQEEIKAVEPHEDASKDIKELVIDLEDGIPSDEIESLCMECKAMGKTKFMYTKIPMFKEIILSSFFCEECGFKNTEVQFGGKLGVQGNKFVFTINDAQCLNRSIVKSEYATIRIPELDFEIPPQTQKGSINTVEGIIARSVEGLSDLQEERRRYDPAIAAKIDEFVAKLVQYQEGKVLPFTFELIDPSGNSFIQNPFAPKADPNLIESKFMRTAMDYQLMGYPVNEAELMVEQDQAQEEGIEALKKPMNDPNKAINMTKNEQDKLMTKVSAWAKRADPEIVA
jgi:zinc finger protein